jgi:Arc/MetJ family transcription regulator
VLNPFFATMRTTLALDDDLLATAERYTGLKEKSALIREALRALIERESARRLAARAARRRHDSDELFGVG